MRFSDNSTAQKQTTTHAGASVDALSPEESVLVGLDATDNLIDKIDAPAAQSSSPKDPTSNLKKIRLLGIDFAPLTYTETLDIVDQLIACGKASFFITANLNYAMLTDRNPSLTVVNDEAAFIVADGMPIIWYGRLFGQKLPHRVAGADLIYGLSQRSATHGHRVFLLGAAPGVAAKAAENLCLRYPKLKIVGIESPIFDKLSPDQHAMLLDRILATQPDLLIAAFCQPNGEIWLKENYKLLGIPVCIQLGASIDFAAGHAKRAHLWVQKSGLEWLHRVWQNPAKMAPRYLKNAVFLLKATIRAVLESFRT